MSRLTGTAKGRWIVAVCLSTAVAVIAAVLLLNNRDREPTASAVQESAPASASASATASGPTPSQASTEPAPTETPQTEDPVSEPLPEQQPDPATQAPAAPPPPDPGPEREAELATVDQPVAPPAPIDQPSRQDGVEVTVAGLEAVVGEAEGIGQIGGPAIRFRVIVTNSTSSAIDLTDALVNVEAGPDREPGTVLAGPGVTALPESVEPGQTVEATYVFMVPPELRTAVVILFNYSAAAPILAFEGSAPA